MQDMTIYITYISPEGSTIYNNFKEKNRIDNLENSITFIRQQYPNCYFYIYLFDYIPEDSLEYVFSTDIVYDFDNFCRKINNKDTERYN